MIRSRRRLLAVGPLPPPVNGMSKAFELFANGIGEFGWDVATVNLADPRGRRGYSFNLGRASSASRAVVEAWSKLPRCDALYLTISQSRLGFIKDALMLSAVRALGKPYAVHLHGGNFRAFYEALPTATQWTARQLLGGARRIIALGDGLREDFSMIPGWDERTVVVWNPCDVKALLPRKAPRGVLRILYISSLILEKGYRELLAAIPLLAERLPAWKIELHLAGDFSPVPGSILPTASAMKEDLAKTLELMPRSVVIKWHGLVMGARKEELLERCDVFVLPTYYDMEGQPIAVLEAITSALPVVTTRYRGIPDTLPAAMDKLYVPPRDAGAIADRLALLANSPAYYEEASAAAVAHAPAFRPERHLKAMAEVLDSLMR